MQSGRLLHERRNLASRNGILILQAGRAPLAGIVCPVAVAVQVRSARGAGKMAKTKKTARELAAMVRCRPVLVVSRRLGGHVGDAVLFLQGSLTGLGRARSAEQYQP